jgi:cardiolipin synthase
VNLANKISILRIILIPFFIAAVIYNRMDIAIIFFAAAIVTDGLDGFIARTFNQKTQLGTILDPVADKLLLTSAVILLSIAGSIPQALRLPPYVPIIVISRDVMIIIGSIIVFVIHGDIKVAPSAIGKTTTFFQMMTIVSVLIGFKYSYIVWNTAVALTVASGADYIFRGSRLLNGSRAAKEEVKR